MAHAKLIELDPHDRSYFRRDAMDMLKGPFQRACLVVVDEKGCIEILSNRGERTQLVGFLMFAVDHVIRKCDENEE